MIQQPLRSTLHSLLFASALMLTACSPSKATQENYSKMGPVMTREEVYALLGKPDSVDVSGVPPLTTSTETWKNGPSTITVTFNGDQMIMKNIRDEGHSY